MNAKFELAQSAEDDKWYFHLKAPNGKVIAASEGYNQKRNAKKGIAAVKKFAASAKVEEKP
jgi:uncharacterized protein YegP (UPF0339 family)